MHKGLSVHVLRSTAMSKGLILYSELCVQVKVLECVEDLLQQPALSCMLGSLHTVCPHIHVCPAALTLKCKTVSV